MTKNYSWVVLLILLTIIGGAVLIRYSGPYRKNANVTMRASGGAPKMGTAIGDLAPDFELTQTDGGEVALRNRGASQPC